MEKSGREEGSPRQIPALGAEGVGLRGSDRLSEVLGEGVVNAAP